jgi:hypothetical protein
MSRLKNVAALSLTIAGTIPAIVEADYRMVQRIHIRDRGPRRGGCCQYGPVAPPILPTNLGVTSFVPFQPQGPCCNNAFIPAAPSQPILVPPVPSACGPAIQPIVQLPLRPQQIVTYHDVPRTEIRREAVAVNVPVTSYKQVTVDEGSYQQVWVPRPVTKSVAETVVQQQVQYREVPVQTMHRIQQVQTVMVPQPTMQYTTGGLYLPTAAAPIIPQAASVGTLPAETLPSIKVPSPPPRTSELPAGKADGGLEWQPVKPRTALGPQTSAVERGHSRAAGRFSPVPAVRALDDVQTALAD